LTVALIAIWRNVSELFGSIPSSSTYCSFLSPDSDEL
jgi:hypothetical protein